MPDTLDLAGVIGTWVAVFLALVALLALLPAYILYRRSRSQVAKALFKVNDPSQTFVSNVFLFGFLLRQNVRVPDLRNPPDLSIFQNAKLELDIKSLASKTGAQKSTTGWIEFAQIITAIFPDVKYGGSSLLAFNDERASLPVHKTWLLALGILHRYSVRKDYGLPLGAAIQDESRDGAFSSGLSGYLNIARFQDQDGMELSRETRMESLQMPKLTRITFKMHGLSSLHKSLKQDPLTLGALAVLFAGYIDGGQGQFFTGTIRHQYRTTYDNRDSLRIAKVTETKIAGGALNVLPGIHVQAKKKIGLVLTGIQDPRPPSRRSDDTEPNVWPQEIIKEVLSSQGLFQVPGSWNYVEVWMLRDDAYRFACAYLKQKPSPHGFLYSADSDFVVSKILWSEDIASILALAKPWLSKADLTGDMLKKVIEAVRSASEAIPTEEPWSTERVWSRRAMQAISSLDDAIDMMASQLAVTPEDKSIMWPAIRAIYASNQDFRNRLKAVLEKLAAQDQQLPIVLLRVEEAKITLLEADGVEIGYSFGFRHVLTEAELDQWSFHNKTMSLLHTVLACLQGQLRAIAWNMTLSPDSLQELKHHASDISLVETYVPQLPDTEVWLESTPRQSTDPQPVFRDEYAAIDVALADIMNNHANRRGSSDLDEDEIRGRTRTRADRIVIPIYEDYGRLTLTAGQPRSPSLSTRSGVIDPPDFGDSGQHTVEKAQLVHSITISVRTFRDGIETPRTRPIASAEGSSS